MCDPGLRIPLDLIAWLTTIRFYSTEHDIRHLTISNNNHTHSGYEVTQSFLPLRDPLQNARAMWAFTLFYAFAVPMGCHFLTPSGRLCTFCVFEVTYDILLFLRSPSNSAWRKMCREVARYVLSVWAGVCNI